MRNESALDQHGQPRSVGFHYADNILKAVHMLEGLILGMLADNKICDDEIMFLTTWLADNNAYADTYPLDVVSERVKAILKDDVITQKEKEDFKQMLSSLIGGTMQETGAAGGMTSTFLADKVGSIVFEGKIFCFTGKFTYGSRHECESAVVSLGGSCIKNITKKLDYLILGMFASRDWKACGHGCKIEKAKYYRDQGSPILILAEDHWRTFI